MRKWLWIPFAVAVVVVILLGHSYRGLLSSGVDFTIQRVPTYWLRAVIVSPLKPEWSFYRSYEASPFPLGNKLITAIRKTGPYAEGLLQRHLSSQDPEVRLFAALALVDMGGEQAEALAQLRELVSLPQRPQSDDYFDAAKAYLAAKALALRGEVMGFDYIASCLERSDHISQRARWEFLTLFWDVLGDSPVWDGLADLDYSRIDPAYDKPAREWYLRNREAIVRELSAGENSDSE